ncbi:hypothetical protein RUND412_001649 [Rhizina undulata]
MLDLLPPIFSRFSMHDLFMLPGMFMETGTSAGSRTRFAGNPKPQPAYPLVPAVITVVTIIVFSVIFSALHYTGRLIITLAVVESPPSIHLPLDDEEFDRDTRKPTQEEGEKYITSSIRGTIRHLREQGGSLALWRGFFPVMALGVAVNTVRGIAGTVFSIFPEFIGRILAGAVAAVLTVRLAVGCTHILISAPSSKRWYRRILSTPWSQAKRTLNPEIILSIFTSIITEMTLFLFHSSLPIAIKAVFGAALFIFSMIVAVPISIILVRMQASLLPDSEEGIVSFDRTFGVEGALDMRSAWRSFRGQGKRLARVVWRVIAGLSVVLVVMGAVVGGEWALVLRGMKVAGDKVMPAQ